MVGFSQMVCRLGQSVKALWPIYVTISGMVTVVRLSHLKKAHLSILVNVLGKSIERRAWQSLKACSSIRVTLGGMVIVDRLCGDE